MRIVECVPNFSEGQNQAVIDQITQAIGAVEGASLLDVDPGAATNRTVVTLVGEPEAVLEAAFEGIRVASEIIDMPVTWETLPMGRRGLTSLIISWYFCNKSRSSAILRSI